MNIANVHIASVLRVPRRQPLSLLIVAVLAAQCANVAASQTAAAAAAMAPVQFDSEFLVAGSGGVDISRFEKTNAVLPGLYRVDIHLNQKSGVRADVPFQAALGTTDVQACFDAALLQRIGIDLERLPEDVHARLQEHCLPIAQAVAGAYADFDFGAQRLDLSVPQVALLHRPRGHVDASAWDAGINATVLGYNLNVYRHDSDAMEGARTQGHLGLNLGTNLAGWRVRHEGSYRFGDGGSRSYQSIASYAKREVASLAAELTVGEAYTRGDLFDSVAFRGARLETDERMLPASLRGYAPTVRGVANSNAKVTIHQNGVLIHESTVAPGAFEINDLYATGYGGDLQVTVLEADGSQRVFSVPFAAVPLSLRPGSHRFSAVVGQLRDGHGGQEPMFAQATWQQDISNRTTGYAGLAVSSGYSSGIVCAALNTHLGAVGADITFSSTQLPGNQDSRGAAYRLSYARDIASTGTHVALAAYRYSTSGFHGLDEAVAMRAGSGRGAGPLAQQQRNRAALTLGQRAGERGRLSVTASLSDYWNRNGSDVNYSAGYSGSINRMSYSVSANRAYLANGKADTQYYAGISIPLGRSRPQTFTSNVAHAGNGRSQIQAALAGAAGEGSALSYGLTASHAQETGGPSDSAISANLAYRASRAELSASASAGSGYSQASLGARGAVVVHAGGWTLSQPVSETFGIVQADDAHGARVLSASGVSVDRRGYAVIPYLAPYQMNAIELDPKGLSTDVELKVSGQQVVPRAGAVALVKFATAYGRSAVLEVRRADGSVLPFGADVLDEAGQEVGVVGQAGRIFARGLQERGRLTVRWSDAADSICSIDYDLPQRTHADAGIQTIAGRCRPEGGLQ